jgi:hypothetical protein
MKYQIIEADTISQLKIEVQKQLDRGWDLQGGVSAVNTNIVRNNEIKYFQAMIYT